MDERQVKQHIERALHMIGQSGFFLGARERAALAVNDLGLGNFAQEGFVSVDILRTGRVRTVIIVLFPNQSLPQHNHPPYGQEEGKEETLRTLWGETLVYVPGEQHTPSVLIPDGKEHYYTVRREIRLKPGEQFTIPPAADHWFQGGPEGSVSITFQNRVDETRNRFADPASTGCPIPLSE